MKRLIPMWTFGVCILASSFALAQEQPPLPGLQPPPAVQPPPPAPAVEARKRVVVTWTIGDQEWDFSDVLSTYEPISGSFDPNINQAIWTLELTKDLLPGEITLHQLEEGTPFKVVLLDAERVPLAVTAAIGITPVSGKKGDRVKASFAVAPDVMKIVKTIRVQRRTRIGFDTPQIIEPK